MTTDHKSTHVESEALPVARCRVLAESNRNDAEYLRREREVDAGLYAPWQQGQAFVKSEQVRKAALMLHQAQKFPGTLDQCLEIGFGCKGGWLTDLLSWGVPEKNLHGIELRPEGVERVSNILPVAVLRVGDASELPWPNDHFQLVVASTVFSSILDSLVRQMVGNEIQRVLAPGGALLWYDAAVNNPRNQQFKRVSVRELFRLFPSLTGEVRSLTLAPPIARRLASRSWSLATLVATIPFLRSHLMAVLTKV